MAKLMAPNIRIDWYPEGHFQDIHNPTIAELNSGVNLSCAIVTGYTLDFTDSNTEDTTTIFDTHASESILNHSYEADLEFFLAPRGTNEKNEEAYRKAEELFYNPENRVGYLAKRFGFPWNQAYDYEQPRQHVDLFKVQADLPKVVSEDGAPILLNVKYIPQGEAVTGAKAGRLNYVWVGEPYKSPSLKVLEDKKITYGWAGEPHKSDSIKYLNGKEIARNVISNPTFELDLHGWTHYQGSYIDRTTAHADRMWGGEGGSHLLFLRVGDSDPQLRLQHSLDISQVRGKWVAVRALVALGHSDQNVSLEIESQTPEGYPTSLDSLDSSTTPFYTGELLTGVTRIPDNVTSSRVFLRFRPGSDDRGWVDKVHASFSDTKQGALDQIEEYFDGDSPTEYEKVFAQNLIINPSFRLGTYGWDAPNSNVTLYTSEGNGHLWNGYTGRHLEAYPSSSVDAFDMDSQTVPLPSGNFVAFSILLASTEEELNSFQVCFTGGGASGTDRGNFGVTVPPEGIRHTGVMRIPNGRTHAYLRSSFRGSGKIDRATQYAEPHLAVGDTREEALAQVQYYFDGDTVDK